MKNLQAFTDRAAISLSMLCALHCLAFPLLIVLLPSIAALELDGEAFHLWMLAAVVPTSAYAITMGCRQHRRYRLVIFGLIGMFFMISAVALGEAFLGSITETWEKVLTLIGAGTLALGHAWNYRLCRHQDDCDCAKP